MVWELRHTLVGLTNPLIFLHLLSKPDDPAAGPADGMRTGTYATRAAEPGWPGAGRLNTEACAALGDEQVVGSYEMQYGEYGQVLRVTVLWHCVNDEDRLVHHVYEKASGSEQCPFDVYLTRKSPRRDHAAMILLM